MTKFKFFNRRSFWRAMLVAVVAGLFGSVVSLLLSRLLDQLFRMTDSDVLYGLFYTLSSMQQVIVAVAWVGIVALFSNWILYPSFLGFSQTVAQRLQLDEETNQPPLPKQFAELEQELAHVRKDLQLWQYAMLEAEKRKDELVVYLAHDIRTPLTSVLGYLELLEESPNLPAENRQKFTATALRKARRMKGLVEELFEVTRFNISSIELHRETIRAGVLLRQLVEEMGPVLRQRQLHIEYSVQEGTQLFADPDKLARAVDNVLHNAAYYASVGTEIQLVCADVGSDTAIEISNTGADIPQAELDRFFEKFYRGDSARQSGTGGSGLGLAIAKNIVEAHGGSISVRNRDLTTTFTILIPKAPSPTRVVAQKPPETNRKP